MFNESFSFRHHKASRQHRRRKCFLPSLEILEDRWMPTAVGVTTTNDVLNIIPSETIG
jgi:hypothetical protein